MITEDGRNIIYASKLVPIGDEFNIDYGKTYVFKGIPRNEKEVRYPFHEKTIKFSSSNFACEMPFIDFQKTIEHQQSKEAYDGFLHMLMLNLVQKGIR